MLEYTAYLAYPADPSEHLCPAIGRDGGGPRSSSVHQSFCTCRRVVPLARREVPWAERVGHVLLGWLAAVVEATDFGFGRMMLAGARRRGAARGGGRVAGGLAG